MIDYLSLFEIELIRRASSLVEMHQNISTTLSQSIER